MVGGVGEVVRRVVFMLVIGVVVVGSRVEVVGSRVDVGRGVDVGVLEVGAYVGVLEEGAPEVSALVVLKTTLLSGVVAFCTDLDIIRPTVVTVDATVGALFTVVVVFGGKPWMSLGILVKSQSYFPHNESPDLDPSPNTSPDRGP